MSPLDFTNLVVPVNRIVELDVAEPGKHYVVYLENGRLVKISDIVKRLLFHIRREKDLAGLASAMERYSVSSSTTELEEFILKEMVPKGLVELPDTPAQKKKHASYLWLHLRLLQGARLEWLARWLIFLFRGRISLAVVVLAATALGLAALKGGLFSFHASDFLSTNSTVVLAILICSFLLHEMGHVVSCYHYGLKPGHLGFGFYMLRPVLFTDMSDGWQLNRRQRSVTALAGMYFQLLMLLPLSLWLIIDSGNSLAKLSLMVVAGATVSNLNPFLRFDGYWILTDLMGVPNIHFRVRQILKHFVLKSIGRQQSGVALPKLQSPLRQFFFVYAAFYLTAMMVFIGVGIYFIVSLLVGNFSLTSVFAPMESIFSARSYEEFGQRVNESGLVISFFFMIVYMILSLLVSLVAGFFRNRTGSTTTADAGVETVSDMGSTS
jgi:putative peptide zinc metalloprotease protein